MACQGVRLMDRYMAFTASIPAEAQYVLEAMESSQKITLGRRLVYKGRLFGKPIIVMITGVGKVNAAQAVTALLENAEIEAIIVGGCGGAYASSGLDIGDIAVATEEIYGDEGVFLQDGWQSMEYIGIPLLEKQQKRYFNRFSLNGKLIKKIVDILKIGAIKSKVLSGPFITVSQVSGSREIGDILYQRFQAICENMEGAAIAHVCTLYDIPLLEIRAISNMIEDRQLSHWNRTVAVQNSQSAILEVVKHWREVICQF